MYLSVLRVYFWGASGPSFAQAADLSSTCRHCRSENFVDNGVMTVSEGLTISQGP